MNTSSPNKIVVIEENELERIIDQCIERQLSPIINLLETFQKTMSLKDDISSVKDLLDTKVLCITSKYTYGTF